MNEYLYTSNYKRRSISIFRLTNGNYGYIDMAGELQTTRGCGSCPLTSEQEAETEAERDIDARLMVVTND